MKPKELLIHHIEYQLVVELEKLGFRYSKGIPKFSRTKGDFELTISFTLSKWNAENYCEFWTMWDVSSKVYSKWYQEQWGDKPVNKAIVGDAEWNIPGWTRKDHFRLKNSESDNAEFEELIHNVINVGIPYYSKISDWNIAAECASSKDRIVFYDKVCDFYLIAGQKGLAKETLELGSKEIEKKKQDQLMLLPKIQMRLDKYFK